MTKNDFEDFSELLSSVHAFYKQDFSDFAATVWWEALKSYSMDAVRLAFTRHAKNPDEGQFMPKPANIVKMLGGTSLDAALSAWSKVEHAIRTVGTYHSVVFDDALIHRVIHDMGGWVKLGACPNEDDFVFVGKDFQNRYRGFAMRNECGDYPRMLIGMAAAQNSLRGIKPQVPQAIGNPDACLKVYRGGSDGAGVSAQPLRLTDGGLKLITSTSGTDAA